MSLLARARMSLGVALRHLLPDERLATAARWTGRALRIAWHLGDRPLLGLALRMHGNELRKAGASRCRDHASQRDVLFSPFTVREVRLRGLPATGRTAQAADLTGRYPADSGPPSPH